MRCGPSLKLLGVFTGIATVLAATLSTPVSGQQGTSDNELSETLSWMNNSYNPIEISAYMGTVAPGGTRPKAEVLTTKFLFQALLKHLHTMAAK